MEITSEVLLDLKGGRPKDSHWRIRVALGFCAGVFVATILGIFSARGRDELGSWWALAMCFNMIALVFVALAWQGAAYLFSRVISRDGWIIPGILFLCTWVASLLLVGLAAALLDFSSFGAVLTFAPFVSAVAFFWCVGRNAGLKSCLFAGVLLLIICTRLLTLPAAVEVADYPFAVSQQDDIRVMSWNLGGGAPFFSGSEEEDIGQIADVAKRHGVHILCLQEVSSGQFLNMLTARLGDEWKGGRSPGGAKSTAILSRIGGEVNAPLSTMEYGGPTVLRINSHKGLLQFVSCHGSPGRNSGQRRVMVEWILHELRDMKKKTVITGDFNIDTSRGWTLLAPLVSDSIAFDLATWRALGLMGEDPGSRGMATSSLGRRSSWMVVDPKMPITGYSVLQDEQAGSMDHFPVFLRVGLGRAGRVSAPD